MTKLVSSSPREIGIFPVESQIVDLQRAVWKDLPGSHSVHSPKSSFRIGDVVKNTGLGEDQLGSEGVDLPVMQSKSQPNPIKTPTNIGFFSDSDQSLRTE